MKRKTTLSNIINIIMVVLQWEVTAEMNQLLNVASALDIRVGVVAIM